MKATIYSLGVRALYTGPAFNLSAHRAGVAVLCCGIGGPMRLARDPANASDWVACRTLLVPADVLQLVQFSADPIACLYLDPQSDDVGAIAKAMKHRHGSLATHHDREAAICGLLQKAAHRQIEVDQLRKELATVLRFPTLGLTDDRVVQVLARMQAAPGDAHLLTTLALSVDLSPSRLQHLFKASMGIPLRRFRIWNRLGAAIAVAAKGGSLTRAAYYGGFSSAAHFSSAFRAMFGLSPSDLVRARIEVIAPRQKDRRKAEGR